MAHFKNPFELLPFEPNLGLLEIPFYFKSERPKCIKDRGPLSTTHFMLKLFDNKDAVTLQMILHLLLVYLHVSLAALGSVHTRAEYAA